MTTAAPVTIKKYGNRRLYDTQNSRYVTLEELAEKVRGGTDVRVVDAKTGGDLTRATLTQIIIEGRGAAQLLPVNLLTQLIRLSDDALAEFFGRYVSGALELYQQMRRGAQSVAPYNPLASIPMAATDALARMWMSNPFQAPGLGGPPPAAGPSAGTPSAHGPAATGDAPPPEEPAPRGPAPERPPTDPGKDGSASQDGSPAAPGGDSEVAALRRELEELKRSMESSGEARRGDAHRGGARGQDRRRARRQGSRNRR